MSHPLIRWVLCLLPVFITTARAAPPQIRLQEFVRGFDNPVHLTSDGTPRLFVTEQRGAIRLITNGTLTKRPYLDIQNHVQSGGECGLLSVAFHPNCAKNGLLYVDYTNGQPNLHTVISEFHADPRADSVDPSTERILLTIDQPYPNHNGGQVAFGPDGMLYIGMGDGGAANDPQDRAQNPRELLGKVLRIDVTPRQGYAIPKDNPFAKNPSVRPEIWTVGMRNPWRFSFDRKTGQCWTGDVGQNEWEEVDILAAGNNYGWNLREGTHPFGQWRRRPPPVFQPNPKFTDPVKDYPHGVGLSITGGFVYRGKLIPDLDGWYLYADYAKGQLWGLKYESGKLTADAQLAQTRGQPASFGEDARGELYLCDYGHGSILKILPAK